jgi:hypothetical protein
MSFAYPFYLAPLLAVASLASVEYHAVYISTTTGDSAFFHPILNVTSILFPVSSVAGPRTRPRHLTPQDSERGRDWKFMLSYDRN